MTKRAKAAFTVSSQNIITYLDLFMDIFGQYFGNVADLSLCFAQFTG